MTAANWSDTPAGMIARLDASLLRRGEDIVLQRLTLGPAGVQIPFSVTCRAVVRGYTIEELIAESGVDQKDRKVIISPTEITQAQWPGPVPKTGDKRVDQRVPLEGDRIIRNGVPMIVQSAEGFDPAGELVRIEIKARGI